MSQGDDFTVSIVLNKDVILTPETQQLLESLGIKHKETSQYELVGSVLSHRHVVKSLIVLQMRVTAIMKSGVPFAGLDDVIAVTLNNIIPIKTVQQNRSECSEEVYRTNAPILTNNIGIMPNEELVIRRSGDLLSLAHQQFEIQLNEADLKRIQEKSIRKEQYAFIVPDDAMWRVMSMRAYSMDEIVSQVNYHDLALFCRTSVDTGYYSTTALFKFQRPIYSADGKKTDVLSWLEHAYAYGELPEACDLEHPILVKWRAMVKAPEFGTHEFDQFMAFHVCRFRSIQSAVKVEGGCVVTDKGPVRLRDYFAQYDEIGHAHQS